MGLVGPVRLLAGDAVFHPKAAISSGVNARKSCIVQEDVQARAEHPDDLGRAVTVGRSNLTYANFVICYVRHVVYENPLDTVS